MSNKSKRPFGKREENALLRIPAGSGNSEALHAFAAKYKRSYHSAYLKHKSLHESGGNTTPRVSKKQANNIVAMSFKDVAFEGKRTRVTAEEEISMHKGLEQAIAGPLSSNNRAILFPTRMVNKARKYLSKKHPASVFTFHVNKDNTKFMLLAKRS